jgi:hypothetical protein
MNLITLKINIYTMPESQTHLNLVKKIKNYVDSNIPNGKNFLILSDTPESLNNLPPIINNEFRPDVFAEDNNGRIIIGEAKTTKDLETLHTKSQIKCFIQHLMEKEGSVFILATPLYSINTAKNMIGIIKRKLGAENVESIFIAG